MDNKTLRQQIIDNAKKLCVDYVGFGSIERFKDEPVLKIFDKTKTVICLGFRVLRGSFRGIEEGISYHQYCTTGVECIEETMMPMALLKLSGILEDAGYLAVPQKQNQLITADPEDTNPEITYEDIYRGVPGETQLNYVKSAVLCGIGEIGFSGRVLTDENGPFQRFCFILTDAELEETPLATPHLCDGCKECVKACHGNAIKDNGEVDNWKCAVYYNGANGLKNPFMPPDAFKDFEDRVAIISGEAKVTPETARKILRNIYFYPPAQHAYQCSICGRACDMNCYVHLEEKGVLTKSFKTPFRKRDEWSFDIEDFK